MENTPTKKDTHTWSLPPDILTPEKTFDQWELGSVVLLQHTASTNLWLKEHADRCPEGTIVIADAQSAGKGRFSRTWVSPPGKNIYMSWLLQPGSNPLHWPQTTQVIALELAQLLNSWGFPIQVKWPNDLLWNKHKICGVLAEKFTLPQRQVLILGLGLNVNSPASDFAHVGRPATSLAEICGHALNREVLLHYFLERVERALELFARQGIAPWLDAWAKMDNFQGSPARLIQQNQTLYGFVDGIRPDGSLLFRTESGEKIPVYSGDLEI